MRFVFCRQRAEKKSLELFRAAEMCSRLVKQMAEREGITEQLKAENQMEWVRQMNNIRNRANEMVLRELIYNA